MCGVQSMEADVAVQRERGKGLRDTQSPPPCMGAALGWSRRVLVCMGQESGNGGRTKAGRVGCKDDVEAQYDMTAAAARPAAIAAWRAAPRGVESVWVSVLGSGGWDWDGDTRRSCHGRIIMSERAAQKRMEVATEWEREEMSESCGALGDRRVRMCGMRNVEA